VYDLLLRDATIVSSSGRQVADVAIQDGRIAYVGPNPPKRRAKEEIQAIGRFLMPGVIDVAVHFDAADGKVWERESRAALSGGVTSMMVLPGGPDGVVDRKAARHRAENGAGTSWCNYGLWGAIEADNAEEMRQAAATGLVRGLFARLSEDGAVRPEDLRKFKDVPGVLAVQLEGAWATDAALQNGVGKGLLEVAREHGRPLHIMHLSTAAELQLLDPVRGALPVTAGVTPHHLFFSEEGLNGLASKMKTRPPVRAEQDRRSLWTALKRGRLDLVASDHHLVPTDCDERGLPGAELMFPLMLSAVKFGRLSLEMLVSLCSEAPARIFGLSKKGRIAAGMDADLVLFTEGELAKVDGASLVSGAGWSPYVDREAAPKPEVVMLDGKIVARKGKIVGTEPTGRFFGREENLATA
jgi:dihydroorotase